MAVLVLVTTTATTTGWPQAWEKRQLRIKVTKGTPVTLTLTIWVQTRSNIETGLIEQRACLCEYVYVEGIE